MKRLFHLLVAIFLLISCSDGVNSPYVIYDVSGPILSEYHSTAIAFDSKNVAWIGTFRQGLIKYDGSATVYNSANSNLPDSVAMWSLAVDKNNIVWIASNKGLIKFENNTFHIYDKTNTPLTRDNVGSVAIDKDNAVWFTSSVYREGGVMKFDGINWTFFNSQSSDMPICSVRNIKIDNQNNKWVTVNDAINKNGIIKINDNNVTFYSSDVMNIPLYYLGSLAVGQDNVVYASIDYTLSSLYDTTRPNIIMFNGDSWKVINPVDAKGKSLGYVGSIATDLYGNLWASTFEQGLAVYNGAKWSKVKADIDLTISSSITPDKNNRIWVTSYDGIYIFE